MIHLGIATAGDVIVVLLVVGVDHLHVQGVILLPQILQGDKTLHVRAVRLLAGKRFARVNGGLLNGLANYRLGAGLADLAHQNFVNGLNNFCFNFAAGENAQLVIITHHIASQRYLAFAPPSTVCGCHLPSTTL
ncbi:hypothetical protein D3C76_1544280 [compost metagenome]